MGKVLIVKGGYSETLDKDINKTPSLGDVLRTTVILNYFKREQVTWLVDAQALPLLQGNPYISRILTFSSRTLHQVQKEHFDLIINLEKTPSCCSFIDRIKSKKRLGFYYGKNKVLMQDYLSGKRIFASDLDYYKNSPDGLYWQQVLAKIIGRKWRNEKYILGYKPKTKIRYDIGFNWAIGKNWNNKAWPKRYWQQLEGLIKDKYSVSWQQGIGNLYRYIDWINSCRLIITNDSLGMHLSIALKKKIIALFGPSASKEVYLYNRGIKIFPRVSYSCIPCLKKVCSRKRNCMEFIFPQEVKKRVEELLS